MTQQQRAVMQQALEALIYASSYCDTYPEIESLRQLLEQPEPVQEPQAFLHWYDNAHWGNEDFKEGCHRSWNAAIEHTTPPAQPAAWVGLTDEEIAEAGQLTVEGPRMLPYAFARAIEAKLKEKNT
jgi:hypothetical protein